MNNKIESIEINEKLQKVENIRGEMEEDDFMTKTTRYMIRIM